MAGDRGGYGWDSGDLWPCRARRAVTHPDAVTSQVVQLNESSATPGDQAGPSRVITVDGLDQLIRVLVADGWTVIAPTVVDGVIRPALVGSVAELPRGVGDEQQPGRYRLRARDDDALFGFANPARTSHKA